MKRYRYLWIGVAFLLCAAAVCGCGRKQDSGAVRRFGLVRERLAKEKIALSE